MSGIVIVGGGQAAAALAAKLRGAGYDGAVTIIGEEPVAPYQRPPLSKGYLLGEMPVERLGLRSPEWWAAQNITLRTGETVVSIDRTTQTITTAGGETVPYAQLALCTGATPRQLPKELGGALQNVFTVRTLADVDAMRAKFREGGRLVVVGGGYIGLEAAAVARKLGLTVTLIEAAPRILGRVACAETAAAVHALHADHGVALIEGTGLTRLTGETHVTGADLSNGRHIPADFAIVGIGVTPNAELAHAAGLVVDNGIVTDEYCRTNDPLIWAAGDCAAFPWQGEYLRLESVGNAIDMGETVALNMLGQNKPYHPKPWFWSDQFDVKLQIAGLNTGYDQVVARGRATPSFWYFRQGRLIAVDTLNDPRAYMVGKRLIEGAIPVTPEQIGTTQDLKALLK